jgi:Zn-dependent metalloprotease
MSRFRALAVAAATLAQAATPPDLGPDQRLLPQATWQDGLGQVHTRYQHTFLGRRVWGSELILHDGPGAGPTSGALALSRLGALAPPRLGALAIRPIAPSLAAAAGGGESIWYPVYLQVPALAQPDGANAALFTPVLKELRPATLYHRQPAAPDGDGPIQDVIVDDENGRVLEVLPGTLELTPVRGTGRSFYRGTRSFDISRGDDGRFVLADTTRPASGANAVVDLGYKASGLRTFMRKDSSLWGDGRPEDPGAVVGTDNWETVAVDLAMGIQESWDYFKTIHGRLGPDGKGAPVDGRVHYDDPDPNQSFQDNAFFMRLPGLGQTITVGRAVQYWPHTSRETIGHEFTHGMTMAGAGLVFAGESGGLNEGTSDFFGAMVQTWFANGAGALIGNGGTHWGVRFMPSSGGASEVVRNFIRPDLVSPGWTPSPVAWSFTLASLKPHYASGPLNRALYFLSQGSSANPADQAFAALLATPMAGIGNDKAARVWYRALTTYLTPSSGYLEARTAALRAATDLYGPNEVAAVAKAFAAIAVGPPTPFATPSTTGFRCTATLADGQWTLGGTFDTAPAPLAVQFFVDNIYVGSVTAPPWNLPLDAARLLASGDHTARANLYSSQGLEATTAPGTFVADLPVQQLLEDPGFEGGGSGWTGPRDRIVRPDPGQRENHAGFRRVMVDGAASQGRDLELSQRVTIPAATSMARLRFWSRVEGLPDPARPAWFSVALRTVPGAGGVPVETELGTGLNAPGENGWIEHVFDLPGRAGQTLDLVFHFQVEPGTLQLHLDDVILQAANPERADLKVGPDLTAALISFYEHGTAQVTLAATLTGGLDPSVVWSQGDHPGGVLAGTQYTQPAQAGDYSLEVRSASDPAVVQRVPVKVNPQVTLVGPLRAVPPGALLTVLAYLDPALDRSTLRWPVGAVVNENPNFPGFASLRVRAPLASGPAAVEVTGGAHGDTWRWAYQVVPAFSLAAVPATIRLATQATVDFGAEDENGLPRAVSWTVLEGEAGGRVWDTGR